MRPYFLPIILLGFALSYTACTSAIKPENPPQPLIPSMGTIYHNQVGYEPQSPKLAFVQNESSTPLDWALISADGGVVKRGQTTPLGYSARADQSLHTLDFSGVTTIGHHYHLNVNGIQSATFKIGTSLYNTMKRDALSYFYHNRSAVPVDARYVGTAHARPAGHPKDHVTCFTGEDMWGAQWPGCNYTLDVTGGWYDAGDHGKYVVNSGISVWTLLNAYEKFGHDFQDGQSRIPEAGNKVNDILDEARTNIEFMLAMQIPEGQSAWVARRRQETGKPLELTKIEKAGGLVHHKVHAETWPGSSTYPHEHKAPRHLYPPSTGATLNIAAIGAYCARLWANIDPEFAQKCQRASERAFQAAKAHDDIFAYGNFDGGGPYGDEDYADEFAWVAMERGNTIAQQNRTLPDAPGFDRTAMLGHLAQGHKDIILAQADRFLDDIPNEPLHIPFAEDNYTWGSNSVLVNRGIVLGHAYLLTSKRKYRDGVVHIMDYLLGRNPLGQSYISGYGTRTFVNPHHRYWSHSLREGAPIVPAGVLSGGPNNDYMADPIAENQVGTCAAQTCWTDHYSAWTQNEVTINWNAPLFWVSAFLDATAEDQP